MSFLKKNYMEGPISKEELACVYSALLLADDDIPITADKISTIVKAAGVNMEPIWPSLFARALQGLNIRELITGAAAMAAGGTAEGRGGGTGASTAGAAAATAAAVADKPEEKKEEAKADEEDSEDEDFGLSLFD